MNEEKTLKAPFPWFGGKRLVAPEIWERIGDPQVYVEPFFGSGAVLFARKTRPAVEIVNDKDRFLSNAFRAIQKAPDEVARMLNVPVIEQEIRARHRKIHADNEFAERMDNDVEFYDAQYAAWWVWGMSATIAGSFTTPQKNNSVPHLTGGHGVCRDLGGEPPPGQKWDEADAHIQRMIRHQDGLTEWFRSIAARLRFTKVCCGNWDRVVTKAATYGQGLAAVVLDPPYDTEDCVDVYHNGAEARGVSAQVRQWAIENGDNPMLRIALCGYSDEHSMPDNWSVFKWQATGGYGNQRVDRTNTNNQKERIWFSPHCLSPAQIEMF
jgi:site-specific DNA-adenine methylase